MRHEDITPGVIHAYARNKYDFPKMLSVIAVELVTPANRDAITKRYDLPNPYALTRRSCHPNGQWNVIGRWVDSDTRRGIVAVAPRTIRSTWEASVAEQTALQARQDERQAARQRLEQAGAEAVLRINRSLDRAPGVAWRVPPGPYTVGVFVPLPALVQIAALAERR